VSRGALRTHACTALLGPKRIHDVTLLLSQRLLGEGQWDDSSMTLFGGAIPVEVPTMPIHYRALSMLRRKSEQVAQAERVTRLSNALMYGKRGEKVRTGNDIHSHTL